ncbi:hypothetical protein RCH17_003827, partial [Arthrobacter sp. MP_M7]|nr:hypothetical protein [Arthrobacter sp. MP_M4]MEC5204995.1 hypothetical protein [Arthrobacter sp. MP_M7]
RGPSCRQHPPIGGVRSYNGEPAKPLNDTTIPATGLVDDDG